MTNEEKLVLAAAIVGVFVLEPLIGFKEACVIGVPLIAGTLWRSVFRSRQSDTPQSHNPPGFNKEL